MHARFLAIAVAAMTIGAAAHAEPPKAPAADAGTPPATRQSPVVLASAEHVVQPVPAQEAAVPAKRSRAARVTTCRCGDPQAPQAQAQDQP